MDQHTAAPIRVLIVDDHDVFASSLAQVLALEPDLLTLGTAHSIAEARTMIPQHPAGRGAHGPPPARR